MSLYDDEMRVMRIVGLATGDPSPFDGEYVVAYDHDTRKLDTTPNVADATLFTIDAATEMWTMVDPKEPRRADGKPNRPLTAFTVEMLPPEDAPAAD